MRDTNYLTYALMICVICLWMIIIAAIDEQEFNKEIDEVVNKVMIKETGGKLR